MKFRNILHMSVAVLFCTASMFGQSSHTWVSGSGVDNTTCSFTSPCATFAGALAYTTSGGLITAKDAGDFGYVGISTPVTIDGNNVGSITFTSLQGAGIDISAGVNVTVRNLTIDGLGSGNFGIAVNGSTVIVDNCKISNFKNDGIFFQGTGLVTVENSRIESFIGTNQPNGILVAGTGAENLVVKNTVIDASPTTNGNSGIYLSNGSGPVMASLQNVTILDAGNYGVMAESGVTEITGSVITQSFKGVYALDGATVSLANSLITANSTGVCAYPTSKIRLDNNDIYDNTIAIGNCGGIVKTSTTNKTSGTISIPAADVSESVTF